MARAKRRRPSRAASRKGGRKAARSMTRDSRGRFKRKRR